MYKSMFIERYVGFNRYIVECKLLKLREFSSVSFVLIDT